MELSFEKSVVLQVPPGSHSQTLALLPPTTDKKSRSNLHKLLIGLPTGALECYETKKGQLIKSWSCNVNSSDDESGGTNNTDQRMNDDEGGNLKSKAMNLFKSSSNNNNNTTNNNTNSKYTDKKAYKTSPITHVTTTSSKTFVSTPTSIYGISKKGKTFFTLSPNLTENITSISVFDTLILCATEYIFTSYNDGLESEYYISTDGAVDCMCYDIIGEKHYTFLGCRDRCIRVIESAKVRCTLDLDVEVVSMVVVPSNVRDNYTFVVYGTKEGAVTLLKLTHSERDTKATHIWTIPPSPSSSSSNKAASNASITSIVLRDLTESGIPDIITSSTNGIVQVFSFDDTTNTSSASLYNNTTPPVRTFYHDLGESIQGLVAGRVCSEDCEEILVLCYSGEVVSFALEGGGGEDEGEKKAKLKVSKEERIRGIEREVGELEREIREKRRNVNLDNSNSSSSAMAMSQPKFPCQTSFSLDSTSSSYILSIELPLTLDSVLLTSTVNVDILTPSSSSSSTENDTNEEAIVTRTIDPKGELKLIACWKMNETSNRLQMNLRTTEGEYGEIRATILAGAQTKAAPGTAKIVAFLVKPLSLHSRAMSFRDDEKDRALNCLRLTGEFGMNVAHEWIRANLPEVPPYQESSGVDEEKVLMFRNVFTGSVLRIVYRKNMMVVESDNISTLAIFKETVSRESTARRVKVSDKIEVKEESIPGFLGLLHYRLQNLLVLERQVDIIEALKEISQSETTNTWLSPAYKTILLNANKIKQEHATRPQMLQYLSGLITDLFVDRHKFRGVDVRHRIGELQGVIGEYDFERLLGCFGNHFE